MSVITLHNWEQSHREPTWPTLGEDGKCLRFRLNLSPLLCLFTFQCPEIRLKLKEFIRYLPIGLTINPSATASFGPWPSPQNFSFYRGHSTSCLPMLLKVFSHAISSTLGLASFRGSSNAPCRYLLRRKYGLTKKKLL